MAMKDEEPGTWWERLSRAARLGLVVGVAAIVAGAIALMVWSSRGDYGVLFSQLNETDAASVVAQLKQQKVPYRLTAGGSTIEVRGTSCADKAMGPTIDAIAPSAHAAGLTKLRCVEQSGGVVFARDL